VNSLALAAPAAHPLSKSKHLRLREMTDARFIWFPRRESAAFYDRLMYECFRGGLKSPRIISGSVERSDDTDARRSRHGRRFRRRNRPLACPDGVAILKVADLKLSLPLALVWRKDNLSPLLSRFVTDVGSLVKRRPTTRQDGKSRDRI
jgi:hypothetical protein